MIQHILRILQADMDYIEGLLSRHCEVAKVSFELTSGSQDRQRRNVGDEKRVLIKQDEINRNFIKLDKEIFHDLDCK